MSAEIQVRVLRFLIRVNEAYSVPELAGDLFMRQAEIRSALNSLLNRREVEPLGTSKTNARCYGITDAGRARVAEIDRVAECRCVISCADDPATACSLSGEFHTHPDDGSDTFGPCPVHPDAPGDV